MKFVRLPVVAVILAGALAAAPAAVAAARPPDPAVITGRGHGMTVGRADPLPPGLSSVPAPDYYTTPNSVWAGWADVAYTNVELRYVAANFVVPTVSCVSPGYEASFWVGLDGDQEGSTVEQVGVEVVCNSQANPVYFSFWEMYPSNVTPVGSVSPGDDIEASVYYDAPTGVYTMYLNDNRHSAADINLPAGCPSGYTCHNKTAEVIAEDPGGGPPKVGLAQFSPVNFTGCAVTSRDGTRGTLEANSLWNSNELIMQYQDPMASPGDRVNGYTAFTDYWHGGG